MTDLQQKMGSMIFAAVAPALIMMLIGSLIWFCAEVVYYSEHLERIRIILAWWVFGSVLVCRIAITEGQERSIGFGLALAAVVWFAMMRFVEVRGLLAPFEFLLHLGFILASWWCASKLVWDCTVVDNSRDTTSRGLLGRVKLERLFGAGSGQEDADDSDEEEIFGATSDQPVAKPNILQQIVRMGRKANTPGLTVVYFSLAAIPIFGFGQGFIAADDVASRQFAFQMFVCYMVAALGLLLTTSLLSLQLYLHKRDVAMPNPVALTWVATGLVAILVVLAAAWILPRPYSEYSMGESPIKFESPSDLESSRYAMFGNDGPDDQESDRVNQDREKSGEQVSKEGKEKSSQGRDDSKSKNETSGGKSEGKSQSKSEQSESKQQSKGEPESKSDSKDGKSNDGKSNKQEQGKQGKQDDGKQGKSDEKQDSSESKSSDSSDSKSKQESSKQESQQHDDSKQSNSKQADQNKSEPDDGEDSKKSDSDQQQSDAEQSKQNADKSQSEQQQGKSKSSEQQEKQQKPRSRMKLNPTFGAFITILKWLCYFIFAIVGAFFAWKHRRRIARAWREFVEEVKQFFARLFGKKKPLQDESVDETFSPTVSRRGFHQFADPFASGHSKRMPSEELAKYCFAAFEAWAADNGVPRNPDMTPIEFAKLIGERQRRIKREAKSIAEIYSAAVYSDSRLSSSVHENLKHIWQMLQTSDIPPLPESIDPLTGSVIAG